VLALNGVPNDEKKKAVCSARPKGTTLEEFCKLQKIGSLTDGMQHSLFLLAQEEFIIEANQDLIDEVKQQMKNERPNLFEIISNIGDRGTVFKQLDLSKLSTWDVLPGENGTEVKSCMGYFNGEPAIGVVVEGKQIFGEKNIQGAVTEAFLKKLQKDPMTVAVHWDSKKIAPVRRGEDVTWENVPVEMAVGYRRSHNNASGATQTTDNGQMKLLVEVPANMHEDSKLMGANKIEGNTYVVWAQPKDGDGNEVNKDDKKHMTASDAMDADLRIFQKMDKANVVMLTDAALQALQIEKLLPILDKLNDLQAGCLSDAQARAILERLQRHLDSLPNNETRRLFVQSLPPAFLARFGDANLMVVLPYLSDKQFALLPSGAAGINTLSALVNKGLMKKLNMVPLPFLAHLYILLQEGTKILELEVIQPEKTAVSLPKGNLLLGEIRGGRKLNKVSETVIKSGQKSNGENGDSQKLSYDLSMPQSRLKGLAANDEKTKETLKVILDSFVGKYIKDINTLSATAKSEAGDSIKKLQAEIARNKMTFYQLVEAFSSIKGDKDPDKKKVASERVQAFEKEMKGKEKQLEDFKIQLDAGISPCIAKVLALLSEPEILKQLLEAGYANAPAYTAFILSITENFSLLVTSYNELLRNIVETNVANVEISKGKEFFSTIRADILQKLAAMGLLENLEQVDQVLKPSHLLRTNLDTKMDGKPLKYGYPDRELPAYTQLLLELYGGVGQVGEGLKKKKEEIKKESTDLKNKIISENDSSTAKERIKLYVVIASEDFKKTESLALRKEVDLMNNVSFPFSSLALMIGAAKTQIVEPKSNSNLLNYLKLLYKKKGDNSLSVPIGIHHLRVTEDTILKKGLDTEAGVPPRVESAKSRSEERRVGKEC
jgi:hypothetical protein